MSSFKFTLALTEEVIWDSHVDTQRILQVVGLVAEGQSFLGHMYVSPVIIPQICDFLKFLMVRKVNDLFANEPDIVFILNQVDLLLVIHDKE